MLGNLLGFDVEAEMRCASTRRWIRNEEREVRKMERHRSLESGTENDIENEEDSEDGTVSLTEIFQKTIEGVQREQEERNQKQEEERKYFEAPDLQDVGKCVSFCKCGI